jgi:hypothetical protein
MLPVVVILAVVKYAAVLALALVAKLAIAVP